MKTEKWGIEKWSAIIVVLLAFLVGIALLLGNMRRESTSTSRTADTPGNQDVHARVQTARRELIASLLSALQETIRKKELAKTAELQKNLEKQGDEAVSPITTALAKREDWNYSNALLEVLGKIRTPKATRALGDFYLTLAPHDAGYKTEVIRHIAKYGGSNAREELGRILTAETDQKLRSEIARNLAQLGLRPDELAAFSSKDRAELEGPVAQKAAHRNRIEQLEKLDPKDDKSLSELKQTALQEGVITVALLAFEKLEARGDTEAANILAERARNKNESSDAKIIQTNAIATLTRMRIKEARLAIREFVMHQEPSWMT
jgi:hypothetical protein